MYFLKPGEEHAPKDAVDCANAAINAVGAVMAKIKPGMRGYEVDAIGRQSIIDSGFPPFPHATGHQVGLEVHDGGTTLGPKKRYSASGILRKMKFMRWSRLFCRTAISAVQLLKIMCS